MVIDASVWVAAFLARDRHREEVLGFLRRVLDSNATVAIPTLALVEIGGAIARRSSAAEPAIRAVRFVREQAWIEVVPLDIGLADAAASIAVHHRLRGADAVYAALASSRGVALVTLDQEIAARAGDAIEVLAPRDWSQSGLG